MKKARTPTARKRAPKAKDTASKEQPARNVALTGVGDLGRRPLPEKTTEDRVKESHKYIQETIVTGAAPRKEIDITKDIGVSKLALDEYVTLDWQHYEDIRKLTKGIYEYTKDPTRRRPLNIIMLADPGSGKSHFIKSLAKKIARYRLKVVPFNMSSLRGVDDFIQPLEDVRNIKVVDKIPLLFLDEFDSHERNYSLLLPLLWDGELGVGQRQLRIGKVVTILAGSNNEINEVMKHSKGMQPETLGDIGKLRDLLSRINGGEFTIPGLDEVAGERDRRVDKVCLAISLLTQRFPLLSVVPWALLRFVAETRFRYGVRSISHLIDLIPSDDEQKTTLKMEELKFPLDSVKALKGNSLAFHLIAEDGPAAVIETWRRLKSSRTSVRFLAPNNVEFDEYLQRVFEKEANRLKAQS